MSTIAIGRPHLKMHGFAGDRLLARCEDPGCTVDAHGQAGCGRLACPSCGFSGSNVIAPPRYDGTALALCSCGRTWVPEPERVRAAA